MKGFSRKVALFLFTLCIHGFQAQEIAETPSIISVDVTSPDHSDQPGPYDPPPMEPFVEHANPSGPYVVPGDTPMYKGDPHPDVYQGNPPYHSGSPNAPVYEGNPSGDYHGHHHEHGHHHHHHGHHHDHDHHHHHDHGHDHHHHDHGHDHHEHDHEHHHHTVDKFHQLMYGWIPSHPILSSMLGIGVSTLLPAILVCLVLTHIPSLLMNGLLAFAIGAVLGDVFLHLLPHALGSHSSHDHHHHSWQDMQSSLYVLSGILAYFTLERLLHLYSGASGHHHHHHHEHEHAVAHEKKKDTVTPDDAPTETVMSEPETPKKTLRKRRPSKKKDEVVSAPLKKETSHHHHHHKKWNQAVVHTLASATHCFTDGLTLALSFIASPAAGVSSVLAIFFHELPHKIGDYAVFKAHGLSKGETFLMMFISSLGGLVGTGLASTLWMVSTLEDDSGFSHKQVTEIIVPFTAGGLVYLALVNVMSELTAHQQKGLKGFVELLVQVAGFVAGVWVMVYIALTE